ncbi:hypothetical protein KC926_02145 [Candidatus Kaiserbacteria bacterium]|nr:hypothetical protein [Candidatus Kaiserbacteria bacterium]
MLPDKNENQILHELMLENQRLLIENNQLLKTLKRATVWSFWLKVVWFMILIGAPFVVYYYLIEPYFSSLGSSFQTFQSGLQEIPGWKQFYEAISGGKTGGE